MKSRVIIILTVVLVVLTACSSTLTVGDVKNNKYSNEYFDLAYTPIKGMSVFPNETIKELFDYTYGDVLENEETIHLFLVAKSLEDDEIIPRMSLQASKCDKSITPLDYAVEAKMDLNNILDNSKLFYEDVDGNAIISIYGDTLDADKNRLYIQFYYWKTSDYMMTLTYLSDYELKEQRTKWIEGISIKVN